MSDPLAVYLVILVTTIADALRDVWTVGPNRRGWWPRHLAKWVAFYLPLVWLLMIAGPPEWYGGGWMWFSALVVAAWAAWRITAMAAGSRWRSAWWNLLTRGRSR